MSILKYVKNKFLNNDVLERFNEVLLKIADLFYFMRITDKKIKYLNITTVEVE